MINNRNIHSMRFYVDMRNGLSIRSSRAAHIYKLTIEWNR